MCRFANVQMMRSDHVPISKITTVVATVLLFTVLVISCSESKRELTDKELLAQYCTQSADTDYADALNKIFPEHYFDGKKIIGCGQSTHGSHENFIIQAELFKYLVKNYGCRTFVVEANYSSVLWVNNYVHGSSLSKEEVMQHLSFWCWDTEELWNLVEWVRQFNATATEQTSILFLGNDMQTPATCASGVCEFFERNGDEQLDSAIALLRPILNDTMGSDSLKNVHGDALFENEIKQLCDRTAHIEEKRMESDEDLKLAKYTITILQQSLELTQTGMRGNYYRDSAMAANIKWITDAGLRGGPVFVWAHNGHIQCTNRSMGGWIKKAYGDKYCALGVDFYAGSFNARQPNPDSIGPIRDREDVTKPMACVIREDTNALAWKCQQLNQGLTFLNCEELTEGVNAGSSHFPVAEIHFVGLLFAPDSAYTVVKNCMSNVSLSRTYSAFIFFGRSTPTALLDTPHLKNKFIE